jgi:hypothetical protein
VLHLGFAGGTLMQKIASCLEVLDGFMRQSCPVVASMVVADKSAGTGGPASIISYVASIIGMQEVTYLKCDNFFVILNKC